MNASCSPSERDSQMREAGVYMLGRLAVLDYCINTIKDPLS